MIINIVHNSDKRLKTILMDKKSIHLSKLVIFNVVGQVFLMLIVAVQIITRDG